MAGKSTSWPILIGVAALLSAACGADADGEDTVNYRLAHVNPTSNPTHECAAEPLAQDEDLQELGLEGQVVPDAQLGEEGELAQQVDNDQLEMALVGANIAAEWNERLAVLEGFYLYDDVEHALEVHEGEMAGEIFDELLEQSNLRRAGSWLTGERHVFADRAIRGPADTAGMAIRVPESNVSIESSNGIGADPTPLAFAETYTGLQQGLVNAAENGIAVGHAQAWHEPAEFVSLTGHNVTALLLLVSDEWWRDLSSEQRTAVEEAIERYGEANTECVLEEDQANMDEWRENGDVEIVEDVDREAMRAAVVEHFRDGDFAWNDDYFGILAESGNLPE